jgi:hypothetical protein
VRLEGLGQLKKIHVIIIRARDLVACSIVPQPNTLPRAPLYLGSNLILFHNLRPCLPSYLSSSGVSTKILYAFLVSLVCANVSSAKHIWRPRLVILNCITTAEVIWFAHQIYLILRDLHLLKEIHYVLLSIGKRILQLPSINIATD